MTPPDFNVPTPPPPPVPPSFARRLHPPTTRRSRTTLGISRARTRRPEADSAARTEIRARAGAVEHGLLRELEHDREPEPRLWVEHAARTDRGYVRANNEDSHIVASVTRLGSTCFCQASCRCMAGPADAVLLAVADGMGGAAAGEYASHRAIQALGCMTRDRLAAIAEIEDEEQRFDLARCEIRRRVEKIDQNLVREGEENEELRGMGTTMTMALVLGRRILVAHVGDSRAYLHRQGRLHKITSDHTWVQWLLDNGRITPDRARTHRSRHMLTNVLGSTTLGVNVEFHELNALDGDTLVLCTDGLSDVATPEDVETILARTTNMDRVANDLLNHALRMGGPDNVTVVAARVVLDEPRRR